MSDSPSLPRADLRRRVAFRSATFAASSGYCPAGFPLHVSFEYRATNASQTWPDAAPQVHPDDVTSLAAKGEPLAASAMDMFFAFLGTVASDLAVTLGARGGVYITGGLGLWIDGSSRKGRAAPTYTGTALSAGIASHSVMGNQTLMRVQAKIIHLLPSGPIYDISRTIIQVGVGFSIFMRL